MQIWIRKKQTKNRSKTVFGKVLGAVWQRFGALCGLFWTLLGALGESFWPSKPNFYKPLAQDGLGFGDGLGRIWMGLGTTWALEIEAFASHGRLSSTLCVPCCLTFCYRNPRAASLRLAERHNFLNVTLYALPTGLNPGRFWSGSACCPRAGILDVFASGSARCPRARILDFFTSGSARSPCARILDFFTSGSFKFDL